MMEDNNMGNILRDHITEYQQQIEQHQQTIIALQGAIQALERLQKEQEEAIDSSG